MKTYKHPVWSDVFISRPDDDPAPLDNGWLPLLTPEQERRFDELELETDLEPQSDDAE